MFTKFEPHNGQKFVRTILAVSIAAIGTAAWAEDDEIRELITPTNTVEVGMGWVSDDSFKFGDYTGLKHSGPHLIGNIELNRRVNDGPGYFMLNARDLGLDSRSLDIETGVQGNYGFRLSYDEIPKLFSDSYQTPFINPGSTDLRLPTGFVRGTATTNMTTLNGSMRPFAVESKRESLGLGFGKQLPKGWDVDLRVKREHKDGNRFTAGVIGNSGGNPRAAIVPEPVNYTTDEIEALARYTDKKLQLQFGYYGSFFRNQNNSLTWANPFASSVWVAGTTPGVSAYNQGSLALPPDNQFHQVSASAGYTLTKDTRLSGSFSLGRMLQNDAFLPYTVNSALAATATPLPRSSLNGRIDTTHLGMKITSKLMPKLGFHALYRYDERDNKTPQAQYAYIGGDSQSQAAAGLGKVRTNLPGSSRKQQIDAELDYHYSTSTTFKLGYDYEWAKKTFEAIKDEREHTIKADVHQHFNDMVSGGFGYAYSDRKTSAYDASAPFLASFSPAYAATQFTTTLPLNGYWDNVPAQKKFFMAPRKRDKIKAFLNVTPTENVDLHMDVDYKDDDYHASQYGLQRATGWAINLDASFRATDALSGHVFTSLDRYSTGQRSIALAGLRANVLNPANDWTAGIVDKTISWGAGVRYAPARKYEVGGDVVRAHSTGSVTVWTGNGPALTTVQAMPLPDLKTRLSRVDLFGTYKLQKDVAVKVKYVFERFNSADWAIDQVLPASMGNVIGTNETSPNYNVHFVGVSLSYQF